MPGTTHIEKCTAALAGSSRVLPEDVRREYLTAMGIQAWYDPFISIPLIDPQVDVLEQHVVSSEKNPVDNIVEAVADALVSSSSHANQLVEVARTPLEKASTTDLTQKNTSEIADSTSLDELNVAINQCQMCELHTTRDHAISGEGSATADLMIVISAPVKEELSDEVVLFCNSQKEFLRKMLHAIGIDFSSVYMTSLVKCKPPEQRMPFTSEMICCDDHLSSQIKLIQPKVIMVLGERASQQLLVSQKILTDLRLRHHQHLGVPVYCSFHPDEIINSTETKRKVWQDLLQIKNQLIKQKEV